MRSATGSSTGSRMADQRLVELEDGGALSIVEVGSGHPMFVLHGGPGLDHHYFRPWLDPLGEQGLRLIYVDMRGQGASPRVDPSTLSVSGFAQDVDRLARALGIDEFALYGHSFGAIVALGHALQQGSAAQYVISHGAASSEALMGDVEREIDRFEPASMRDQIRRSWQEEASVETAQQARDLIAAQMPFHFWEMGDAYRTFTERDDTMYSPEVLSHFAANGYGDFEWVDHLRWISKPMLVVAGRFDRTCTVARAEEIHTEVAGSKLVVIEKAGHMSFVEQPKTYLAAIRQWFTDLGVIGQTDDAQGA
jgi:proline-specific peptidase